MFIFLIFYDTRWILFVDLYLNLLHHKTLFCDGYKAKVRRGYFEKNRKPCRKGKSIKNVAAKFNLPGSSLHGRKIKKNLTHLKLQH